MPEREDDHLTPATRLLEKRREMAEVEQALNAQKEVSVSRLFFSSLCCRVWILRLIRAIKNLSADEYYLYVFAVSHEY